MMADKIIAFSEGAQHLFSRRAQPRIIGEGEHKTQAFVQSQNLPGRCKMSFAKCTEQGELFCRGISAANKAQALKRSEAGRGFSGLSRRGC